MGAVLRYDEACRAIADAKTFADITALRDKAEALAVYARIAKNKQLEVDAAEIRFRAERKLGAMIVETGISRGRPENVPGGNIFPTLASIGVDRKLSAKAQRYSCLPEEKFESLVGRWRDKVLLQHERVPANLLKLDELAERRNEREWNRREGAVEDLAALAASGFRAGAILADPPWHFAARGEDGEGRSAVAHYSTEGLDSIAALPVAALAADDCVLFLWSVDWLPRGALDLIDNWGFEHKTTAFTWAKTTRSLQALTQGQPSDPGFWHMGQGYWTRANPETCLLATKGSPARLNADVRQLLVAPVTEHSRKPDEIHDRIERLVAGPYLELYARRERKGWTVWGDELEWKGAK